MHAPTWFIPAVACAALACLLGAHSRQSRLGIYLCKPLTSCCFIAYALAQGTAFAPGGRIFLLAQALCWVGDVLLMLPGSGPFLAGLVSFLLGHAGYAWALGERIAQPAWLPTGVFAGMMLSTSLVVYRWLSPHIPKPMLWPVRSYVMMITLMTLAAAAQTAWPFGPYFAVIGAVLFYLSDICVARERFVAPTLLHTYVGLPLYYVGQMLLAASAGVQSAAPPMP